MACTKGQHGSGCIRHALKYSLKKISQHNTTIPYSLTTFHAAWRQRSCTCCVNTCSTHLSQLFPYTQSDFKIFQVHAVSGFTKVYKGLQTLVYRYRHSPNLTSARSASTNPFQNERFPVLPLIAMQHQQKRRQIASSAT